MERLKGRDIKAWLAVFLLLFYWLGGGCPPKKDPKDCPVKIFCPGSTSNLKSEGASNTRTTVEPRLKLPTSSPFFQNFPAYDFSCEPAPRVVLGVFVRRSFWWFGFTFSFESFFGNRLSNRNYQLDQRQFLLTRHSLHPRLSWKKIHISMRQLKPPFR